MLWSAPLAALTASVRHAPSPAPTVEIRHRAMVLTYLVFEGEFPRTEVGGLPTELVPHFFRSLSDTLGASIQISVQGENTHHMVEACFKGTGRALRMALERKGTDLPSTKGAL